MRADHDVLFTASWQISRDIPDRGLLTHDVNPHCDLDTFGKSERDRRALASHLTLQFGDGLVRALEPFVCRGVLCLHDQYFRIFGARYGAEPDQRVLVLRVWIAVDQDDRLRSVIASVDCLGNKARVMRVIGPVPSGVVLAKTLRLV